MNKKLLLSLTSSALLLLLTACGESSTEEVASELRKDAESEQVEAEKKKDEVIEETGEEEATTETEDVNKNIADDDFVKIDLKNVERTKDEIFGDSIKVNFEIENKTDRKIIVQSRDVSADGYMVDDIAVFSAEIVGGKKIKDALVLEEMFLPEGEELPELNENLEMTLIVFDDETFDDIGSYEVNIDF
ncbi:hypothetical protein [Nosocomiicoccus massiliensis]|uniref:DUF4352 domain-containing protein n=1 Tax=Nosocomiicoccus massiliensis TaxID=1232430 RepID=A0AAF0YNA7_9STAP|nr:hypothetical protein [Nosocomiicoccus massiliensis]WOS96624.1 hypothetical protein CJ229_002450 [Nosocomiicoccus massiliensis]